MKIFRLTAAALAVVLTCGAANALPLTLTTTGQTKLIANNDLGLGLNGQTIDFIDGSVKSASNGLSLFGAGLLKYTYLGREAGNTNLSVQGVAQSVIFTASSVVGSSVYASAAAGLVDFAFKTTFPSQAAGIIRNNGVANPNSVDYAIGYSKISHTKWYVLFDDIASNDRDFDDFGMTVEVVPLPAAGFMLLSVLGGFAVLRRRFGNA